MKKLVLIAFVAIVAVCFTASAFAGTNTLNPGAKTSCNNANSITLEIAGKSGSDRGNANATLWRSANYITQAVTISQGEHYGFAGDRKVGMPDKSSKGASKVTFGKQNNFSRGDSIGDISGEVRITNTGTVPIKVSCN
ncbi:MAG: hypothetical protein ACE5EK_03750 [Nitrospinales bacterium]